MTLFSTAATEINFVAVLIATVLSMMVGYIWYAPTAFGNAWIESVGFTEKQKKEAQKHSMTPIVLKTLILTFAGSLTLALFIPQTASWHEGMFIGTLTGVGLISTTTIINHLYERRDSLHTLITCGHTIIIFSLIGLVLGAF